MQGKRLTFLHVFHRAWVVLMVFWWLQAAQSLQQTAETSVDSARVLMMT